MPPKPILKLRLTLRIEGVYIPIHECFHYSKHPQNQRISHGSSEKYVHGLLSCMSEWFKWYSMLSITDTCWIKISVEVHGTVSSLVFGCTNFFRPFTKSLTTQTPKQLNTQTPKRPNPFLRRWQINFGHSHPFRVRHTNNDATMTRWLVCLKPRVSPLSESECIESYDDHSHESCFSYQIIRKACVCFPGNKKTWPRVQSLSYMILYTEDPCDMKKAPEDIKLFESMEFLWFQAFPFNVSSRTIDFATFWLELKEHFAWVCSCLVSRKKTGGLCDAADSGLQRVRNLPWICQLFVGLKLIPVISVQYNWWLFCVHFTTPTSLQA